MGVATTMLSIGGLNFPAVWGWPRVARGYRSRLTVVSRGLIGGADTPGKGGMGGWELIPILTQNVGLLCGRNQSWGGGGAEGD